jgi:hypothetical protein
MIFSIGFLPCSDDLWYRATTLVVFSIAFEAATLFHHSNWRLPIQVERILEPVVVTPRLHGIHHSIVQRETNSNWGTIFAGGTNYIARCAAMCRRTPLPVFAAYRDEDELTLGKLFALPFRQQSAWRLL